MFALAVFAAEVIPPAPEKFFNDYAGVVSPGTAAQLNQRLEQFERDTSSQILVAIFPKMQSDSSIEDYTVRVAQSWKAGQKGKDNGAVLFVFAQDHKLYLQVGYGLEGALPDALCKRIIANEITPRFKAGDFDGGLSAGVSAILAATKGEYTGSGRTVASNQNVPLLPLLVGGFVVIVVLFSLVRASRKQRGMVYRRGGYSSYGGWGIGGGSSGGGGFSGGGGSFGGGGAGGSW